MRDKQIPEALYVSFVHKKNEDPKSFLNVQNLLVDKFGRGGVTCITESDAEESHSHETIYRISTPAVVNDDVWRDFFEKLLKVFTFTKEFYPHFASYEEVS